ncbi:hypothetical protein IOLA_173 [uncultured bacterium]|nr:hypothetical protein IOLA_173 [uncultured bacterium]
MVFILFFIFIYFRGFWLLNLCKNYFYVGSNRNIYFAKELELIYLLPNNKKVITSKKEFFEKKYKDMLKNEDLRISYKISNKRVLCIYEKYKIINEFNLFLNNEIESYIRILIKKDYNKCLNSLLNFLLQNKKNAHKLF